jgi:hypothetical protein
LRLKVKIGIGKRAWRKLPKDNSPSSGLPDAKREFTGQMVSLFHNFERIQIPKPLALVSSRKNTFQIVEKRN